VGDVAAAVWQYLGIGSEMPFSAGRRGEFNTVRLQGRQMPGMTRGTTMGMWTAIVVVVKIQGNGGLNAGEAN